VHQHDRLKFAARQRTAISHSRRTAGGYRVFGPEARTVHVGNTSNRRDVSAGPDTARVVRRNIFLTSTTFGNYSQAFDRLVQLRLPGGKARKRPKLALSGPASEWIAKLSRRVVSYREKNATITPT